MDGTVPPWLRGTLIRNGPAVFDTRGRSLRHWFDGQAMLHRFAIDGGTVGYANRLLDTPSLRHLRERGRIGYAEFATDPCGSLFGRFFTRFTRRPSTNANVNVTSVAGRPVAVTEVPLAVEFDPDTLATLGVTGYDGGFQGALTTAHPHAVPGGDDLVNYVLRFGRSSEYVGLPAAGGAAQGCRGGPLGDRPSGLRPQLRRDRPLRRAGGVPARRQPAGAVAAAAGPSSRTTAGDPSSACASS